ncbi:DinB family protein [Actinokineospora guangxiensis]|uniref:DinB family protein n=1 Tax=Actinokineospora guangxiensis TaxID=1490288 RepID=A0ABW0EJ81_9PSEU
MWSQDVFSEPLRAQLEAFIDEHRDYLNGCLQGITEEEARRSLVPSRTTLLGLVKHGVFVEEVWFNQAVTCLPREEIGIPETPGETFILTDEDTVESIRARHAAACERSRARVAELGMDDLLRGNRRGPLPLRWVYLHVLRELAQHCGHADILREQIISARMPG